MIDPKDLIKLAKACRKAGIFKLKTSEFEFEIHSEEPGTRTRRAKSQKPEDLNPDKVEVKEPTLEELIGWSSDSPGVPIEGLPQ